MEQFYDKVSASAAYIRACLLYTSVLALLIRLILVQALDRLNGQHAVLQLQRDLILLEARQIHVQLIGCLLYTSSEYGPDPGAKELSTDQPQALRGLLHAFARWKRLQ